MMVVSPCDHTRQGFRFHPPEPNHRADIVCSACSQVIGYATHCDGVLRIDLRDDRPSIALCERAEENLGLS